MALKFSTILIENYCPRRTLICFYNKNHEAHICSSFEARLSRFKRKLGNNMYLPPPHLEFWQFEAGYSLANCLFFHQSLGLAFLGGWAIGFRYSGILGHIFQYSHPLLPPFSKKAAYKKCVFGITRVNYKVVAYKVKACKQLWFHNYTFFYKQLSCLALRFRIVKNKQLLSNRRCSNIPKT